MQKPTSLLTDWATATNYASGPEAGSATKVAYTNDQQLYGHKWNTPPSAPELNTWQYNVHQWITWLKERGSPMLLIHENWMGFGQVVPMSATLPIRFDSANTAMGMSADDPNNTTSSAGVFHYYSPTFGSIGIQLGDKVTLVRAKYSGNGSASTMSLRVVHHREDTGDFDTSASSTLAATVLTVVPAAGKNTIETHTMIDQMWAIFEGSASGVTLEAIDVYWERPVHNPMWYSSATNGASLTTVVDSDDDRPGPWLRMRVPGDAAAVGTFYTRTRPAQGPMPDNNASVLEFFIDATGIAGTKDVVFKMGLYHDEGLDVSTEDQIQIWKDADSANWMFQTSDSPSGPVQETDTGVAATGVQKFRIEIYGSDDVGGARVLLYINNALEATHTTHLPNGQAMTLGAFFRNDEILIADLDVFISPLTYFADKIGA